MSEYAKDAYKKIVQYRVDTQEEKDMALLIDVVNEEIKASNMKNKEHAIAPMPSGYVYDARLCTTMRNGRKKKIAIENKKREENVTEFSTDLLNVEKIQNYRLKIIEDDLYDFFLYVFYEKDNVYFKYPLNYIIECDTRVMRFKKTQYDDTSEEYVDKEVYLIPKKDKYKHILNKNK